LYRSSSKVIAWPITEVEKPHWGLTVSLSRGRCRAASRTRTYLIQETAKGRVGLLKTSGDQKLAKGFGLGNVTLGIREVRALK
jgi:hypothetical protein